MPPSQADTPGAPCWVDLFTSDPDKAEAFYGGLFGWTAEHMGEEYGGYINFHKQGRAVAGCMRNDGSAGTPDAWSVYLATDDAQATAEAAISQGGLVVVPVMEMPGKGAMAVLTDVDEAAIGAWQPGTPEGLGLIGESGAPTWFELYARRYDAAVEFYRQVFGWDTHVMSDTDEFRYTTLGEGDSALAGIMDANATLREGVPAHWGVYFGVDDTDASIVRARDLGGSVVRPAEDTPYGRLAELTDPTGAAFKLVASP